MQHNLIDVYRVMLYPLALGTGKRFFKDGGDTTTLTLTDVSTNGAGVVMLTYQPTARDAEESAANQRENRRLIKQVAAGPFTPPALAGIRSDFAPPDAVPTPTIRSALTAQRVHKCVHAPCRYSMMTSRRPPKDQAG